MTTVAAIFDIGKTNKKLLCFDEGYRLVYEEIARLPETEDEDGYPCEDLAGLTQWMHSQWNQLQARKDFRIKAIHVSAYGASFVHLDREGRVVTPLYNYLKPFQPELADRFYVQYGGRDKISLETASPVLGHLNSGMQLYWLKHCRREQHDRIALSLHLPNYLSSLFHGRYGTEITSVGCHTQLWDYRKKDYHNWVKSEGLDRRFAPWVPSDHVAAVINEPAVVAGPGLHDSSSALIPYLEQFHEPFMLLSTGTWNIALQPFNEDPLTLEQLKEDCLCYLSYKAQPVKASRLLISFVHDEQSARLKEHFHLADLEPYHTAFDPGWVDAKDEEPFENISLQSFGSFKEGYHRMMQALVNRQRRALRFLETGKEKLLFVDGGFSQNEVFMNLLARQLPGVRVGSAVVPQASGLGAALSIHASWNAGPKPSDLIRLRFFDW